MCDAVLDCMHHARPAVYPTCMHVISPCALAALHGVSVHTYMLQERLPTAVHHIVRALPTGMCVLRCFRMMPPPA